MCIADSLFEEYLDHELFSSIFKVWRFGNGVQAYRCAVAPDRTKHVTLHAHSG